MNSWPRKRMVIADLPTPPSPRITCAVARDRKSDVGGAIWRKNETKRL